MNMIAKTAFLACVLVASCVNANGTELHEVNIEVKLLCPPSEELENFRKSSIIKITKIMQNGCRILN